MVPCVNYVFGLQTTGDRAHHYFYALLLLLDLVSCGRVAAPTCLRFSTGKGTKAREIDVGLLERAKTLGIINAKVFLDSTTSLVLTWEANLLELPKSMDRCLYLKLSDDDQAINWFKEL